jgi:hypothetical protein
VLSGPSRVKGVEVRLVPVPKGNGVSVIVFGSTMPDELITVAVHVYGSMPPITLSWADNESPLITLFIVCGVTCILYLLGLADSTARLPVSIMVLITVVLENTKS